MERSKKDKKELKIYSIKFGKSKIWLYIRGIKSQLKIKIMQPTKMLVQAIKHKDVRGKELLYLKIQHEGNEVLVNIGERTYKAIVELVNQQQLKLHAE